MRIVFLNRYYAPDHSATSQLLADLAPALARRGDDVHVITSRLVYDDASIRLPASELRDGVAVHRVWTSGFGRKHAVGRAADYFSFYWSSAARLLTLTRRGDVVVTMTDPPLVSVPATVVAGLRRARTVNWVQDVFPEVAERLGYAIARGIVGSALRRMRDWSLRSADRNVALGSRMRDFIASRSDVSGACEVIPNWADGAAIRPIDGAASPLRLEWGLGRRFVVAYSGNMGRAHEFGTILDAAYSLRPQPDIAFLFIGGGAQRDAVERKAKETGLANCVFKPYQPRHLLEQSLGIADVHLVSLRPDLEGLVVPSKFYGIAAAGRPTLFVGDPDGEIGTALRAAECGICIRAGDSHALVAGILRLQADKSLRIEMGRNARALFASRYDRAIALEKWQRLVEEVGRDSKRSAVSQ